MTVRIENKPLEKLKRGVDQLADTVRETLGPNGKNILIDMGNGNSLSTRDGVTVAHYVKLRDRLENMGAALVRHAAKDTNAEAGDGTSSSTVLAQAIFDEGLKFLAAGHGPIEVKRSIDEAMPGILERLNGIAKLTDNIEKVATISANNDPILGKIIADAIRKVGKDGTVLVEHSTTRNTYVSFQEGLIVERGWEETSPYFINNFQRQVAEYDDAEIAIIEDKIHRFDQVEVFIRHAAKSGRPLLMIVKDIEDSVLAWVIANRLKKGVQIALIKTPGFNDVNLVDDLSCRSGTRYYHPDWNPVSNFKPEDLGGAKKVVVGKSSTTIIQGRGDIGERLAFLNEQIRNETDEIGKTRLQDRINRLTNSVATINLFANSEAEMKDMKLRIEDAINATRHAMAEGIVQGGGTALLRIRPTGDTIGEKILSSAMEKPFWHIIQNAGGNPWAVMSAVEATDEPIGFDANKKEMVNMIDAGIIDPVKVTRTALEKAVSVAGMLLVTGSCLVGDEEDK